MEYMKDKLEIDQQADFDAGIIDQMLLLNQIIQLNMEVEIFLIL